MKLTFTGAAHEVTGSRHLLTVNGKNILLDCGLYQGKRKEAFEINKNFPFDASGIDALILSHAHMDHAGNIPNLVKNGFRGKIYTTAATVDLCQLMLRDSAFLQEKDVKHVNKKRIAQDKTPFEPLYTIEDVENAMKQFIGIQYDHEIEITTGVSAYFFDAGHILGSAGVMVHINEGGKKTSLCFSGDIGRVEMPILRDPVIPENPDIMIMESTYGNRLHSINENVEQETADIINEVVARKGKIIIPAFAVGRIQLLVYVLHKLFDQNRIPMFPIFVDSPLAVNVTEVYRLHPECFDRETYRLFVKDKIDPFGFNRLTYVRDVEESKKLNDFRGACMIISASGMAEGGRILHHLKNNIGDPNNLILFVGYAAKQTLARKIMDGEEEVNIFGSPYKVNSMVKKMDHYSGHADQKGLLEYLRLSPSDKLKNIFLVHGEEEEALPLKAKIEALGYKNVMYPELGYSIEI